MCACLYTHTHACVCLCMGTGLHVYLCVCVHMCLHACVHVYVCTRVCVHTQALQVAECPRQGEKRTWPSWSRETAIQATGCSLPVSGHSTPSPQFHPGTSGSTQVSSQPTFLQSLPSSSLLLCLLFSKKPLLYRGKDHQKLRVGVSSAQDQREGC